MVGRSLLLAWHVSADQEEPWRRFLQELSDTPREEEYVGSRRRLGISALCGLAASEAPFDTWYSSGMRKLFGFELARSPRVAEGELLFAWLEASANGKQEPLRGS